MDHADLLSGGFENDYLSAVLPEDLSCRVTERTGMFRRQFPITSSLIVEGIASEIACAC
jgi:hypothetical protein